MRCLLVVAHGSRRDESNLEILRLTEKVAALSDGRFDRVECAYLELADPLIPDALGHSPQQALLRCWWCLTFLLVVLMLPVTYLNR